MLSGEVIARIIILHAIGIIYSVLAILFAACEEIAAKIAKTYYINLFGAPVEKIQHCQKAR